MNIKFMGYHNTVGITCPTAKEKVGGYFQVGQPVCSRIKNYEIAPLAVVVYAVKGVTVAYAID